MCTKCYQQECLAKIFKTNKKSLMGKELASYLAIHIPTRIMVPPIPCVRICSHTYHDFHVTLFTSNCSLHNYCSHVKLILNISRICRGVHSHQAVFYSLGPHLYSAGSSQWYTVTTFAANMCSNGTGSVL